MFLEEYAGLPSPSFPYSLTSFRFLLTVPFTFTVAFTFLAHASRRFLPLHFA